MDSSEEIRPICSSIEEAIALEDYDMLPSLLEDGLGTEQRVVEALIAKLKTRPNFAQDLQVY